MEPSLCELGGQQALENQVGRVQIPGDSSQDLELVLRPNLLLQPQRGGTAVLLLKCSTILWSTSTENSWPYPTSCKSLGRSLLFLRTGVSARNHHRRGGLAVHGIYSWPGTALGTAESPSSALFSASRLFMFVNNCFLGLSPITPSGNSTGSLKSLEMHVSQK